jgi:predicted nucleic acid-binding protein
MDSALERARQLSTAHTDRLGTRAIDLLHVACALLLECEVFLTFDERQAELAKSEGLKVPGLQAMTS